VLPKSGRWLPTVGQRVASMHNAGKRVVLARGLQFATVINITSI